MSRTKNVEPALSAHADAVPLLQATDALRRRISPTLDVDERAALGQFMTPAVVARFMASLFADSPRKQPLRLLDAGAGIGGLSAAFLERYAVEGYAGQVCAVAYEVDPRLRKELEQTMASYQAVIPGLSTEVHASDFIEDAVNAIQFKTGQRFTHAILNPPYRKINTHSHHRKLLRQVGIETVNLYTAFVALAIELMEEGGELVAIVPRSFCNGPYYRPFRALLLSRGALVHIHLFESRTSAFSDDAVLQENIIFRFVAGRPQGAVTVSTSSDKTLSDLETRTYPFEEIVKGGDSELFIHIPHPADTETATPVSSARCALRDTGLEVSTGPVVDFRLRAFLLQTPTRTSVPLIYANHFVKGELVWPRADAKKANAIISCTETEKWLYPATGWYTVVRRFSSKEEKRRLVAYVIDSGSFKKAKSLGFENHLNVFHCGRRGVDEDTARGLATYLNSTALDEHFRRFSGHTQVNATDLRNMPYPSREDLRRIGRWAKRKRTLTQALIDTYLSRA